MSGIAKTIRHQPVLGASIRLASRCANAPLRWLWRRLSPVTVGTRAIIRSDEGNVLLVRRSIDQRWYLPGEGVRRGEALLDAVAQEVRGETRLTVSSANAAVFGVYSSSLEGKSDHIVVLTCIATGNPQPDGLEIDAVAFFPCPICRRMCPPERAAASPSSMSAGRRHSSVHGKHHLERRYFRSQSETRV